MSELQNWQYASGNMMTKLLWMSGQNPFRNVGGVKHKSVFCYILKKQQRAIILSNMFKL